jgi:TIR domain
MSGIFISYASQDREKAEVLARALEQKGWPVWWDRQIPFGKSFDQEIEDNLAKAKCVLVLWTRVSVDSRWVRSEASEAAARGVLVPVLFEPDVKIPLEFRLLQAVNLSDWHVNADHREFAALVAQIADMLGAATPAEAGGDEGGSRSSAELQRPKITVPQQQVAANELSDLREKTAPNRKPIEPGALVTYVLLPSVLVAIAAVVLANWRIPTHVLLDITVDRVSFTLAGDEAIDIPERALGFRSLAMENFDRAAFTPSGLAIKVPSETRDPRYQPVTTPHSKPAEIVLTAAADAQSTLRIDGAAPASSSAPRLESISAKPGAKVTVETTAGESPGFTLRVDGQALHTNVLSSEELLVSADNIAISGVSGPVLSARPIALRLRLADDTPYLQIEGARRFFVVTATVDATALLPLVTRARISTVEFLKQGAGGSVASSLVTGGTLSYPDRPASASVKVDAGDLIGLRDLKQASITYLRLRSDKAGLDLRLEGVVGHADRASGGAKQHLTSTAFAAAWYRFPWVVLTVVLLWAILIAVGMYKFFRRSRPAP